ncbi:MAG: oxygen-dependent coproporphyrinogen oxidase [Cytophagales bacterium]|nr:oxygen-dependent coproporphyrinogen oxidase [Cytophagales bacterium]MDW8384023.1 oxygen-dependent coproporphyrinogen oxidase [Flammeovirgaceae bacterium]
MVNLQERKIFISNWFESLQANICHALEQADGGASFQEDIWQRAEGGGGKTRVIQNGNILEKGGVLFSAVFGKAPQQILSRFQLENANFFATGVSIVLHPKNPMVPIIHMNVRYFELSDGQWWLGGGIDLTPHYVFLEDAIFFHTELKKVCDKWHKEYYPKFKKWADDYFFLKHRNETRGIGGIFFDELSENETFTFQDRWGFVQDVGLAFAPIYTTLMQKNSSLPYGETEKMWQAIRRSRYVEFNLVYDIGTKFGLETGGRIESILISMPPTAQWHYNYQPAKDSPEAQTLSYLKKGIDWLAIHSPK